MTMSGYVDCKCRDCFETAIASNVRKGAFCSECKDAGCDGDGECQRDGAYGCDDSDDSDDSDAEVV